MRLLAHREGQLSSYFANIDEIEAGITTSSLEHILIDRHTDKDDES